MLQLYFAAGSCSLASHIALLEAGLQFEPIRIDLLKKDQRSERYLSINPKGRVPTLMSAEGPITETPAILGYIATIAAPHSPISLSSAAFAAAQVHSFNSYLCSTVHIAHAHGMRGNRWADEASSIEDMKRKVPRAMTECFELIEGNFMKGEWVHGPAYSISDPYLFTVARWLEGDGVDPSNFPKVAAHRDRMLQRPAVQQALREVGEEVRLLAA